jgi:SAM-dependent methyltransferase
VSGGHWREWQQAALEHVLGNRVLEIGCGPGHLLRDLVQAGYHAFGVDLSPEMWTRAHHEVARAGQPHAVLAADACALPFVGRSFDTIVATFPTPVVRNPRLWDEVARVLRPAGRFVVVLGARRRADATSLVEVDVDWPIPVDLFCFRSFLQPARAGSVHLLVADRVESGTPQLSS